MPDFYFKFQSPPLIHFWLFSPHPVYYFISSIIIFDAVGSIIHSHVYYPRTQASPRSFFHSHLFFDSCEDRPGYEATCLLIIIEPPSFSLTTARDSEEGKATETLGRSHRDFHNSYYHDC